MSSGEILIYGVRPDRDFSLMPNGVIQNDDLSALATWLFAYINSKPPTYALCAKRIGFEKGISRYQALKLLRELRIKKRLIMRRLHSGRIEYRIFSGAEEYDAYLESLPDDELSGILPVREKASYQEKKRTLARGSHRAKSALISKTEIKDQKQQQRCCSAYENNPEQACEDAFARLKQIAQRQQEDAATDAEIQKAFDASGLNLTAEERLAFVTQYGRYATLTSLKKLIAEQQNNVQNVEVTTTTPALKEEKTVVKQEVIQEKPVQIKQPKPVSEETVVPADLSNETKQAYYMLGFNKKQVVDLYKKHGNQKMLQMFDLFKQNQEKVKSPKAWVTAALNQNFEVTAPKQVNITQIETQNALETRLIQERIEEKQKEEARKRADSLASSKLEAWKNAHPDLYEECVRLAFEDTMRAFPFAKIVRQQAKQKNLSHLDAFLQSPFSKAAISLQMRKIQEKQ